MPTRHIDPVHGDQAPPYARLSLRQAECSAFLLDGCEYSVLEAEPEIFAAWFEQVVADVTADDPPRRRLSSQWLNQMRSAALDAEPNPMVRILSRWWALDALLDVAIKRKKNVPLMARTRNRGNK